MSKQTKNAKPAIVAPAPVAAITPVTLAVAVMHKAVAAQAKAETALDRARGNTWAAIKEAALCFDGAASEDDQKALYAALRAEYESRYTNVNAAKSAASQHAKAIVLITQGKGDIKAASLKDYMGSVTAPRADSSKKGGKGSGGATGENSGDEAAGTVDAKPAALSASGLPVEVGSALVRLIEHVRKNPDARDAVILMANKPDLLVEFADYALAKLAGGAPAPVAPATVEPITAMRDAMLKAANKSGKARKAA